MAGKDVVDLYFVAEQLGKADALSGVDADALLLLPQQVFQDVSTARPIRHSVLAELLLRRISFRFTLVP